MESSVWFPLKAEPETGLDFEEVDLGSDARKEEVRGSGWVEKETEKKESEYECVSWRHVVAPQNWVGWGLQTVPLENGGEGKWAKPYPLPPVSIHGMGLYGAQIPCPFQVCLHLGWVERASLLQHQEQALGLAWMGPWSCQRLPPVCGAVPKLSMKLGVRLRGCDVGIMGVCPLEKFQSKIPCFGPQDPSVWLKLTPPSLISHIPSLTLQPQFLQRAMLFPALGPLHILFHVQNAFPLL